MLSYDKTKDILASSVEITRVVDSWKQGVPFFIEHEGRCYDAFIYYSDNIVKKRFNKVQCLILVDLQSGEVRFFDGDEVKRTFEPSENFDIASDTISAADYYNILSQIEEQYKLIREELQGSERAYDCQVQYLKFVKKIVAKQVIDGVYAKFNTMLFVDA